MVKRSETISVTRDASLAVVPKWQQKRGFLFRPPLYPRGPGGLKGADAANEVYERLQEA